MIKRILFYFPHIIPLVLQGRKHSEDKKRVTVIDNKSSATNRDHHPRLQTILWRRSQPKQRLSMTSSSIHHRRQRTFNRQWIIMDTNQDLVSMAGTQLLFINAIGVVSFDPKNLDVLCSYLTTVHLSFWRKKTWSKELFSQILWCLESMKSFFIELRNLSLTLLIGLNHRLISLQWPSCTIEFLVCHK